MASRISPHPVSSLVVLLAGRLAEGQDAEPTGVADESILFHEFACVYAACTHEQKTGAAPFSVTNVIAADIQHCGYRSLSDVRCRSTCGRSCSYTRVRRCGALIQNRPEQDGRAFLLKATCRF